MKPDIRQKQLLLIDRHVETKQTLADYLSDTETAVLWVSDQRSALEALDVEEPRVILVHDDLLSARLRKKLDHYCANGQLRMWAELKDLDPGSEGGGVVLSVNLMKLCREVCLKEYAERPIRVLSVDDDPEIRLGIQEYLELVKGPTFDVQTAGNGLEGYEVFKRFQPDVETAQQRA